jgi:preprotein translocase subunit SecD
VPIYRAAPAYVTVEESPFADERDIAQAAVINWMDGFAVQLKFTDHGKLMLENTTRMNPNRRIAIFAEFGETRWLAAPLISRPINDGHLTFTPDATRAEAERLVRGLNQVAAEIRKRAFN